MRSRLALIPLFVCFVQPGFAQWKDSQKIATGGESTIVSDGKGNVYVTAHIPCALYKSSDWGSTFTKAKDFTDGACDMCVRTLPNGTVDVMYLINGIKGIGTWTSTNAATTLTKGKYLDGSFDREWVSLDPATGAIYMDYSNGYIGGPKSKGVYFVASNDKGASYTDPVRVDREPAGSYAVDPYITRTGSGRIVCMWQVTTDYNSIDAYRTAYSDDNGKTFSVPITVATFPKKVGDKDVDNQERWILGSIQAVGKNDVVVVYPGYDMVDFQGKKMLCFLQHYKVSHDGGASFGDGHSVLSNDELQDALATFTKNSGENLAYDRYIQNLPWLAADPNGGMHLVFTDNRDGASAAAPTKSVANAEVAKGKPLANWRVRHVAMRNTDSGFGRSEAVSNAYAATRPPMDFISCAADAKYVYASWTAIPGNAGDFQFTGDLWMGRRPLK